MGNEAAPRIGNRYTGGGAARPGQILPRPAPTRPILEAGLAPSSFQPLEFDPPFPMALGSILFLILGPVLGSEV